MQNDQALSGYHCKVLNRDIMKYLAIGLMFVGHLISWISHCYNILGLDNIRCSVHSLPAHFPGQAKTAVTGITAMTAAYLCMTIFYNGRKGKHPVFTKCFFYAFYPLHYLVIWGLFRLTS